MGSNYFTELNNINVNDKTEKKGNLTYLSWAWAWGEVKKRHPDAFYTIYENKDGWIYHTDGRTCWVKTGVTVDGLEHIECLPVMDNRNNPIARDKVTSFHVNTAIQRSLTKACARHGLGLYIYAGEDLPEDDTSPAMKTEASEKNVAHVCCDCLKQIVDSKTRQGDIWPADSIAVYSERRYGKKLCPDCMKAAEAALKEDWGKELAEINDHH